MAVFIAFFAAPLLHAMPQKASPRYLKKGVEVAVSKCQKSRTACVCEPGRVARTYIGHKGVRYFQCVSAHCDEGELLREEIQKSGRRRYVCKGSKKR